MIPLVLALWLGTDLGQLTGGVGDASGAVLVDVAVAAVHEETGIRRTARTDIAPAAPPRNTRREVFMDGKDNRG